MGHNTTVPWPRQRQKLLFKGPSRYGGNPKTRLTLEVLILAFQYMSDLAYSPIDALEDMFAVSHVCKTWREVSINHCDEIWSPLPIDMDSASPEVIMEILRRSKISPLFIQSDFPVGSADSWTSRKWMAVFKELHRFEVLSFVDDLDNDEIPRILTNPAPLLQLFEATIDEPSVSTRNVISEKLFGGEAPNLRHLDLTGYRLNSNVLHGLQLTLISVNVKICPPSVAEWLDILSQQPTLISLTIDHALDSDNDSQVQSKSSATVELPLLRELCITHCRSYDCGMLLGRLLTLSLCRLELSVSSNSWREVDEMPLRRSTKQLIDNSDLISQCKLVEISEFNDPETMADAVSISAFSLEDISATQDPVFTLSYLTSAETNLDSNLYMFFEALSATGILSRASAIKLRPLSETDTIMYPNLELLLKFQPKQLNSIEFSDYNQFIMLGNLRPPTYSTEPVLMCENIYLSEGYSSVDPYGQHIDGLVSALQHRYDHFHVKTLTVTIDPGYPIGYPAGKRILQRLDNARSDSFTFELREKDYQYD